MTLILSNEEIENMSVHRIRDAHASLAKEIGSKYGGEMIISKILTGACLVVALLELCRYAPRANAEDPHFPVEPK